MVEWKNIEGYPGYKIGNDGTVLSKRFGQPMVPGRRGDYKTVGIRNSSGPKTFSIHRLVAMAFIPEVASMPHVNHLNGLKWDNRVENLEWANPSTNGLHSAHVLGNFIVPESHYDGDMSKADARPGGTGVKKDYCLRGHSLNRENVYLSKRGYRTCKKCIALHQWRAKRARAKAEGTNHE